jgi:hypothetical protein
VHKKVVCTRTMAQALDNSSWVRDFKPPLSLVGLQQYLMWDMVNEVVLKDEDDIHSWSHETSGIYSAKSCYKALFTGSLAFEPWKRLWKSWAPPKCKFLCLAIRDRVWTADRLQKRGLPHPDVCPLCDQAQETVQHTLTSCVFARQFWFSILSPYSLGHLAPSSSASSFAE